MLKKIAKWLALVISISLLLVAIYFLFIRFYWQQHLQANLLSGLAGLSYIQTKFISEPRTDREVFGFLPYWNLNKAEIPNEVTDLVYFAAVFDGDGELVTRLEDNTAEIGYYRLQQTDFSDWLWEQEQAGKRLHITVVGESAEAIADLVSDPTSRETFNENIKQLLLSYPFSGLQLDFEYAGAAEPGLQANYVSLVKSLYQELKAMNENYLLSVAVFGTAASKTTDFWDIPALAPYVDRLIIMSYDYHVRSSDTAGPVAPLFGKETGRYEDDITSNLRDFLQHVPPDKVLLGIPFYGYEWQVVEGEPGSQTFPSSGSTATYQYVQQLRQNPDLEIKEGWDSAALSPFIVYEESGVERVIYYDNPRSFSYKLDLVNQLGLKGVAIWALGYEGEQTELWDVLSQKFE